MTQVLQSKCSINCFKETFRHQERKYNLAEKILVATAKISKSKDVIILAKFLSNWLAEIIGIMTEKLVVILVGKSWIPCGSKATSEAS
jgi:hypothetical protein